MNEKQLAALDIADKKRLDAGSRLTAKGLVELMSDVGPILRSEFAIRYAMEGGDLTCAQYDLERLAQLGADINVSDLLREIEQRLK